MKDFAQDDLARAAESERHGAAAFEAAGDSAIEGEATVTPARVCEAREFKLVDAGRKLRRADMHGLCHGPARTMLTVNTSVRRMFKNAYP